MTEPSLNDCLVMSLSSIVKGVKNGAIVLHEGQVMMAGRQVIATTTMSSGKVQVLVKALQRIGNLSGRGTLTWKGMVMLATSALDEFEHWPAYSK